MQYFEEKAFLSQRTKIYKQMMVGAGYERVYEVGHVYRAEKHATSRHLNEYVSLDLEMGFIEDEHEIMALENRLLAFMFSYTAERCAKELHILDVEVPSVPAAIPKIALDDALALLTEKYGKQAAGQDLDPEGERLLSEHIKETTGSEFVFVTDYPWEKRPMYTMPKGTGLTAASTSFLGAWRSPREGSASTPTTCWWKTSAKRAWTRTPFLLTLRTSLGACRPTADWRSALNA